MGRKGFPLNRDYVSKPGEILAESLSALGISPGELAWRTGKSPDYVAAVLSGDARITVDFAEKLTTVIAMEPGFWLRLDKNYQYFKQHGREIPPDLQK
ncbi:helix-turn-helix transcriptional regulator [Levilactobacillus mulengensis]|uniref:helix-turn-helix transcriptional regulator n=1 Tax=Levilactobacillus mulengensis TaxID=2486025 RepID=UPI0013DE6C68|nr:addiction module antidote protein, HigA family [Levilactobacillus mulengensis]